MDSTMVHVCLETPAAPTVAEGEHEIGERWACACGNHFVYREGFNRAGYPSVEWWPAPAVPQPRSEKPHSDKPRRGLLFGPRKGS
jgi:hypothetical protein